MTGMKKGQEVLNLGSLLVQLHMQWAGNLPRPLETKERFTRLQVPGSLRQDVPLLVWNG